MLSLVGAGLATSCLNRDCDQTWETSFSVTPAQCAELQGDDSGQDCSLERLICRDLCFEAGAGGSQVDSCEQVGTDDAGNSQFTCTTSTGCR